MIVVTLFLELKVLKVLYVDRSPLTSANNLKALMMLFTLSKVLLRALEAP